MTGGQMQALTSEECHVADKGSLSANYPNLLMSGKMRSGSADSKMSLKATDKNMNTSGTSRKTQSHVRVCFVLGIGILALWLLVKVDFFRPVPLVSQVKRSDVDALKRIFKGGESWLVSCLGPHDDEDGAPPAELVAVAQQLRRSRTHVARVHCFEPLLRGGTQTLAERFEFKDGLPVLMATGGKGEPVLLKRKKAYTIVELMDETMVALAKQRKTAEREQQKTLARRKSQKGSSKFDWTDPKDATLKVCKIVFAFSPILAVSYFFLFTRDTKDEEKRKRAAPYEYWLQTTSKDTLGGFESFTEVH